MCTLVFVEPPDEGLEPWQQLERVLESLEAAPLHSSAAERSQHADNAGCRPASGAGRASGSSNIELRVDPGATFGHTRALRSRAAQPQAAAAQWHRGRALLARRSGVFSSAVCRNESWDALGHLSSDGCMRPWLPSYASLPKPQEDPAAPPHEVLTHHNLLQPNCSATQLSFSPPPPPPPPPAKLVGTAVAFDSCTHGRPSKDMLLVFYNPSLSRPGCMTLTRHTAQTYALQILRTTAVSMKGLAYLHRMVQAAGHAPTQAPQRGVPAHSARLAAPLSRVRHPRAAAPSKTSESSMHRAAVRGLRPPYHCLTPQHRPVRSKAWLAWLKSLPKCILFFEVVPKVSQPTQCVSILSALAGLLRISLGQPDFSALQAARQQHCESSACIRPQSEACARLPRTW